MGKKFYITGLAWRGKTAKDKWRNKESFTVAETKLSLEQGTLTERERLRTAGLLID
jgi:hypothetical protein